MAIEGSRGTKDILTRYPEEVGIEADERHEGIPIALTPKVSYITNDDRKGLNV